MLEKFQVETSRLSIFVRQFRREGTPVFFIHGNGSSSFFWEETMLRLPDGFMGIAPDLRGYGQTEPLPINATTGFLDWIDDFKALRNSLGIERYHIAGHSLGGAFIFALIASESSHILSATLVAPGSPFGFGGTKDKNGTPCYSDFAGSGGGIVNPEFAQLMKQKNRNSDNPQASPRVVMNSFYWKPPFKPQREEEYLTALLSQHVGETAYPGDFVPSENYPFVAPGIYGSINSASPKYLGNSINQFIGAEKKPNILWIRGADDQIVSDNSLFDFGTLGQMGLIPNYPGEDVFPPQPMITQTRFVLDQYQQNNGHYSELVFENTGHSPFIEQPDKFDKAFHDFIAQRN